MTGKSAELAIVTRSRLGKSIRHSVSKKIPRGFFGSKRLWHSAKLFVECFFRAKIAIKQGSFLLDHRYLGVLTHAQLG